MIQHVPNKQEVLNSNRSTNIYEREREREGEGERQREEE
jgi:hypothetical protein